jgi:metallo-beta-lactamase family protein
MKKIKFLGAAGDVTGSNFLITASDDSEMLVDFGMFQGPKAMVKENYKPLGFKPSGLKGVVLTHAHLDHCGRLPMLVFGGYQGKVYMTAPTYSLIDVVLHDAARIAEENMEYEPLYGIEEVEKLLGMVEIVEYNKPFTFGPFRVVLKDAGHILGSASVAVTDTNDNKTIVFSGDLGNSPEDIVKPTEYFESGDYVVMEATYGDSDHPKDDPVQILQEEINAAEKDGGVLLIPAFSLERTQEILHKIHHLKKDGKIKADTPVFLDSPMGIRATAVFKNYKEFYNEELQSHFADPFSFEGLVITESAKDSKEILKAMEPKVIIAGSGMVSGGRMVHHAGTYLPRPSTRILFVGYQAAETPGRKILEGAKSVWIDEKHVTVKAHVRRIQSFSAHADQSKLVEWLRHIKNVKEVFLVHSDTEQRQTFANKIIQDLHLQNVILPEIGQEYPLK